MDIVLVSNGPAELNSLVRPVAYRASLALSAADIWVFPSPGAGVSGRELRVVSAYQGVRRAFSPSESWRLYFAGVRPKGFTVSGRGVVVNLGGSAGFAQMIARRLRYPLIHYVARECPVEPRGSALYLAEDERLQAALIAAGAAPDAVKVVGNLAVDAAVQDGLSAEGRSASAGGATTVGLFPGESARQARAAAPFFLRVAELLARVQPDIGFVLRISPFIGTFALDDLLKPPARRARVEATHATVDRSVVPFQAVTAEGLKVSIDAGPDHSGLAQCDVVLTVPGPICHELAYAGIPYVVAAPSNVPGYLGVSRTSSRISLPFSSSALQRFRSSLPHSSKGDARLVSGPNSRAGKMVAHEAVGAIRPEDVVIPVVEVMEDASRAERIARELREAVGPSGAVDAVIHSMRSVVRAQ